MATKTTETDIFADARATAQANHDAEVAANEALIVPEDTSVKTEIEAQPEVAESTNPEQVEVADDTVVEAPAPETTDSQAE